MRGASLRLKDNLNSRGTERQKNLEPQGHHLISNPGLPLVWKQLSLFMIQRHFDLGSLPSGAGENMREKLCHTFKSALKLFFSVVSKGRICTPVCLQRGQKWDLYAISVYTWIPSLEFPKTWNLWKFTWPRWTSVPSSKRCVNTYLERLLWNLSEMTCKNA